MNKKQLYFSNRRKLYRVVCIAQIIALFFLISCPQVLSDAVLIEKVEKPIRSWTVMVYMAADNELESAAIQDINEFEASQFVDEGISIVALLDRSRGYDETNGDWTDTRLYEISEDAGGLNGVIVSKELSSGELALEAGTPTELNMSDTNTLKKFLKFGRTNYPAEKYALIIWGRGAGWQSVAIDDNSNAAMSLPQLQEAIASSVPKNSNKPLDFIGFDTNFGGNLETTWELKDEADWFAGTSGLAPVSGWDYTEVFAAFTSTEMNTEDFANAVAAQDGVSKVNLQKITQVKESLDELSQLSAQAIKTENVRIVVKNLLLTGVDAYVSNSYPSDKFFDLYDLAEFIKQRTDQISSDVSIQGQLQSSASKLQATLRATVHSGGTPSVTHNLGVYFIPLTSATNPAESHTTEYIQGSGATGQMRFVHDSAGWVPTSGDRSSFLDKIFYASLDVEIPVRPWTVMVYMAADNDLESAAIHDINELEASQFVDEGISIVALLDRSEGYDETNDNWTDTRLYEITEDDGGLNGVIVSKELSYRGLALEAGTPTELNMSDPNTLENFLKFGRTNYPAEHYALIIWGHGTGWRSIAIDDNSNTAMSLPQLQEAIEGSLPQNSNKKLDFIGFDTCFGATLETVWELQDEATWFAGTPGLAPVSGWDYTEVFEFFGKTGMGAEDFANAVANQDGVSKVNLQKIEQVETSFDALVWLTADTIQTKSACDFVKGLLLTDVAAYASNTYPSDKFLDLYDLAELIYENANTISKYNSSIRTQLESSARKLQADLRGAVVSVSGTHKLAIYLIPFTSASIPAVSHTFAYVKGSGVLGQIRLVRDSTGWVPTSGGRTSLLDKVFYTSF